MCLLQASTSFAKMLGQNHFAEPNRACFDFSSSNFLLQGHILSTGGAALKTNLISPHMGSPEKIM
jgi:hypothetical protein